MYRQECEGNEYCRKLSYVAMTMIVFYTACEYSQEWTMTLAAFSADDEIH